jgi:UDP-N-acetylglucosamine 1-carboxyvinyltransferase
MSSIKIIGSQKLIGEISISGAKNAALPILAATILLNGKTTIENVPNLTDIVTIIRLLKALGLRAEYFENENRVVISSMPHIRHIAPYELITRMRASFFVAGPLLAKTGLAKIPLPGGCAIGSRPIDIHLDGFKALGADIKIEHGIVILKAKKLVGADIYLDFPSVGATENIVMAATLAEGKTVLKNAAKEPEIVDLANFLIKAGAKITGAGTDTIIIEGIAELKAVHYRIIPDRVEAASMMIGAVMTKGDILIKNLDLSHLTSITQALKQIGVSMQEEADGLRVVYKKELKPIEIETAPYPGFPTDVQAQLMALLTLVPGTSIITENIFENRFMHAPELNRMGANILVKGKTAIIKGVKKLSAAPVQVTDLRAGIAMWMAAISAEGESTLYETQHIYRGYERLKDKLERLGAVFIDDE